MTRFKIHDESLNTQGFRLLTSGLVLASFLDNPVMSYNHRIADAEDSIPPIGSWENIEVVGNEVYATPVFDLEDKFAKKIAGKVKRKFLRSASVGIRILELSDEPTLKLEGQVLPTVTKWEIRETAIVDIPSNKNAIAVYGDDDKMIDLSDGKEMKSLIAKLSDTNKNFLNKNPQRKKMEDLKLIAGLLGLSPDASLADVQTKILALNAEAVKVKNLSDQLKSFEEKRKELQKGQVKTLLDKAIKDGKIVAAQRTNLEGMFENDFENTKSFLDSMEATKKLSDMITTTGDANTSGEMKYKGKTFSEWSKENPKVLKDLKDNNIEIFKQLYKAEYGNEYSV